MECKASALHLKARELICQTCPGNGSAGKVYTLMYRSKMEVEKWKRS
jgi:hypothetical protein